LFGLDICFLTTGTSFFSTDDKTVSVFLHVPSPGYGQAQQHKSGNIIIYWLSFTENVALTIIDYGIGVSSHSNKINVMKHTR
jgi:hypothetical protein